MIYIWSIKFYICEGEHFMAKLENDLTKGAVARQLVRYAIPLVLSSLLQSIYSITDIIVAGHNVGEAGISAISNASVIMNMVTLIAIGLTIGGNILVSQYFGRGEDEKRKEASGNLALLCIIVGVVAAIGFVTFSEPLLVALGAPALEEAVAYFSICAVGVFFIFSYNALSAILRGVGNSRVPLYCIIISVCLNIFLDILFMVVFKWGVQGAALATLIGQMTSFVAALAFSMRHRERLGLTFAYLRFKRDMIKDVLRLGLPTALQFTIASASWLTVVALINSYGVDVSAGNGVSNKIRDFAQLFTTAMTGAAGTMCAQCIGAKLYERAVEVMKTCVKITLAIAVGLIIVIEIFAPQLCAIFTPDATVQAWAAMNIRIEIIGQAFYALMFSYNTLATGSGHTVFIMWNSFLNCIVVRMILALILNHFFGVVGIYWACGIAVASSVPVSIWFYRSKRWMHAKTRKV